MNETTGVASRGPASCGHERLLADLSAEIKASLRRVRNLIGGDHWPSDGSWKESLLRRVLRERCPRNVEVCTGFVAAADGNSTQIDVLVIDADESVLFRDGEFVIVTANAVVAAIEVKTSVAGWGDEAWRDAIDKCNAVARRVNGPGRHNERFPQALIGFLAYTAGGQPGAGEKAGARAARIAAQQAATGGDQAGEQLSVIGVDSKYFCYRSRSRDGATPEQHEWRCHRAEDRAFGHFVHAVMRRLSPTRAAAEWSVLHPAGLPEPEVVAAWPVATPADAGAPLG